jgi:hypothetical protein
MQVEGQETEPPDDGDRLTAAEIHDSITALAKSDPGMGRLVEYAQGCSGLCGLPWDELLHEAFKRALEGTRTCKRGTDLIPFLCGVMKSFVSQENEARKEGFRPTVVIRNGEPVVPDGQTDDPSPERLAMSAIDGRAQLAKIEAAAVGDEQLQLLIEGIHDGMRGEQLQELLGVDKKGLEAVRTRLKRLLKRVCPDGIAL